MVRIRKSSGGVKSASKIATNSPFAVFNPSAVVDAAGFPGSVARAVAPAPAVVARVQARGLVAAWALVVAQAPPSAEELAEIPADEKSRSGSSGSSAPRGDRGHSVRLSCARPGLIPEPACRILRAWRRPAWQSYRSRALRRAVFARPGRATHRRPGGPRYRSPL